MKVRIAQTGKKSGASQSEKVLRISQDLAETFKMLGNANRLKILVYLDSGEHSVSEIEAALDIHQPTLSQQIGELRDAGLIHGRRAAKSVIYSLREPRGRRALQAIYYAGGEMTPRSRVAGAGSPSQAAGFASVLTHRGGRTPEVRFGFKSLLQDE